MCSLLPLANTISPLPDSPPPLSTLVLVYSLPLSTCTLSALGAPSRANQPSNDACFPTIQTTKKAIQGVGGFSASCSARVGRGAQSHHICPPFPASAWEPLPAAQCRAVCQAPPLHQPFTPVSHQSPKISSQRSPAWLNPPPCHTITPTW